MMGAFMVRLRWLACRSGCRAGRVACGSVSAGRQFLIRSQQPGGRHVADLVGDLPVDRHAILDVDVQVHEGPLVVMVYPYTDTLSGAWQSRACERLHKAG